ASSGGRSADLAQPVTVGALAMRIVSKRHSIHDPLSRFAELCHRAGRRLTSEVTFRGEDGEQGVIWVDESGEVVWAETVAPGRGTSCR
ncbi:hypothetical protein, partial [Streptomyces rubradiris]|uniref:hypothetical protein n=1 Tax=Streptomyces rubradiris TaxID=285531 RepID=UPI001943C043